MNPEEILKRFAIIANISLTEGSPWIFLCEEAGNEIVSHLKDSVDVNENSRRLTVAAASLAFYKYALYNTANGSTESFSAGELRIKNDLPSAVKMAYEVWLNAKHAISDLLRDDNFIFERMDHCAN